MTSTTPKSDPQVIHAAKILEKTKGFVTLLLRKMSEDEYVWFEYLNGDETKTHVIGLTKEDAIRNARKEFAESCFKTINCGFRYTLPERDEHGMNALFYQMKASLLSSNGIYFDEEAGHNCFVQNASDEAKALLNSLKEKGKL